MPSVTPPGRRSRTRPSVSSTTVDSTPTEHSPPSTTAAMRPSRSASTWAAVVGLGEPERLADGAARDRPDSRMTARATGWDGIRTATVGRPALTSSGMRGPFGKIMVSGPGQYARASFTAVSGISAASRGSVSQSAICTIRGLSIGRPLASKIRATAGPFSASAASPYTVSVGIATSSPARSSSAARSRSAGLSVKHRVVCRHIHIRSFQSG